MPSSQHHHAWSPPRRRPPPLVAVAGACLLAVAGCGRTDPEDGDPPDPTQSSLQVDRDGIVANGTDALNVTVTLRNADGVPLAGRKVFFSATGGANLWFPETGQSDSDGVVRALLTSTRAEEKAIVPFLNPETSAVPLQADPAARPRVRFIPGPISAAASKVEVAPSSLVADGVAAARISVVLIDAFGNRVPGKRVVLIPSGTANDVTQPPPGDGLGVSQGSLRSTRAEVKTISARVEPEGENLLLPAQPAVTFTPGPPDRDGSTVVASPAAVVADGVASSLITVTLVDRFRNPVPGQQVLLELVSPSGRVALSQPGAPTDARGIAAGSVASTLAGPVEIRARVNPGAGEVPLSQRAVVTFLPGPPSAAMSQISASPPFIVAGAETSTITVLVRDAFDNPVPGVPVQLSASGGQNTLVQPPPSDAGGAARGTLSSTRSELKTVSAVLGGASPQPLPRTATVGVLPAPVDPDRSRVTAAPATVVADGSSTSTVTVALRDVFDNPVPLMVVQLQATGAGNTVVQPPGPTDLAGIARGTLASTRVEPKTVTAVVNPGATQLVLTQRPVVTFVPGPPSAARSTVTATPPAVTADGVTSSRIDVTVVDDFLNPIAGLPVSLAMSGTGNVVVQPSSPTDAAGRTAGSVRSTVAEVKAVTATVAPGPGQVVLAQQAQVRFTASIPSGTSSSLVAAPATVPADGSSTSAITVTVRDALLNPVPGVTVQLSVAGGSGNVLVQPPPTDASGQCVGTLASAVIGPRTISGVINPGPGQVPIAQTATVSFVPGPPSPTASSVTAAPATVVADGSSRSVITVTVRDGGGNPLAGQTVRLSATGTGNTLVQPAAVTDAGGVATGTVASTVAEAKTLTATVNPGPGQVVLAQQPVVTFIPGPPSATRSTVVANPPSAVADGVQRSTITVTVLDALGNAVRGATVQLSATGAGNSIMQPAGPTDAAGVTSGSIASIAVGQKTVTATVNPGPSQVVLAQQPVVTFVSGPPDPTTSSVTASPATAVADGVAFSTITVVVRDALGRPLPAQAVQLSATGGGNTLTQPAGPTDATGTATGRIASTRTGAKTLTATVNPGPSQVVLAQQPQVTFVPGPPSATLSTVVANPQSVVADGAQRSTITVTVLDAQGNAVPGATVQLAATGTQNLLAQPPGPTDAMGVAVGSLASTAIEVKTLTATVNPGPSQVVLAQRPQVTFTAGPPSPTTSTVTAAPLTVVADGIDTSLISVTVRDALGNPLPSQVVRLGSSGTGNLFQQPANTDAAGFTTGRIASTRAEVKTVRVTVNPGPTEVVLAQQPQITFIPGPPSATASTVVASPARLAADAISRSTITVTVMDANSNPIPGATVSLAATGTANVLVQPGAPTSGSGVATGTLASGQAEVKQVTATVNPGPSQVVLAQRPLVTFVAGTQGDVPGTGCTFGSSVAMDPATGFPAIAYYQGGHLKFTRCTANCVLAPQWTAPETVESNVFSCTDNVARRQLTLLYLAPGTPAIAYRDQTSPTCLARYAVRTPTGWSANTVEDIGQCGVVGSISMVLVEPGVPAVAYHSHLSGVLGQRFAACTAGCAQGGAALLWNRQNVDAIGTNVGHYSSVRMDPVTNRPRIAYQDDISGTDATLKYATCTDANAVQTCARGQGNWSVGIADQVFGVRLGEWASLDLREDGTPLIAHQDAVNQTLRLSTCTSNCGTGAAATWRRETVDAGPFTGHYAFLRIDALGQARIAYFTGFTGLGMVRYAVQSGPGGSTFIISDVEQASFGQVSFVLAPPGTHFAYANTQGLRYYPSGL